MVVREGSNVTLKCAARGSPTPNITWRREGSEPIVIFGQREGGGKYLMNQFDEIFRFTFLADKRCQFGFSRIKRLVTSSTLFRFFNVVSLPRCC